MSAKKVRYELHLDGGVILVLAIDPARSGPAVQPSYIPGSSIPWRAYVPGTVVEIYAPTKTTRGVDWETVAKGLYVPLVVPEKETPHPKRLPAKQLGLL